MGTVHFYLLFLCTAVSCHLCLLDPIQRGGLPEELEPGDEACFKTRECGKESGVPYSEYTKGSKISVTYQKNLNEFNKANPGVFQVWFSLHAGNTMQLMGNYHDEDSPDLTTYTREITLPQQLSDDAIIMVSYDPHGSGVIYYQCGDVKIIEEQSDICMPLTYEAHVEVLRDIYHEHGHHTDVFNEGDYLHIWMDGDAKKLLIHKYDVERAQRRIDEHHTFVLRYYNEGLQWRGHYNRTTKSVSHCALEFYKDPFKRYCLLYNPIYEGSGTLGKNNPVDYYNGTFKDPGNNIVEEIHITVEKGSLTRSVIEQVEGKKDPDIHWMEFRQFFDMSETKLDPTVFFIPDECPH